MKKTIRAKTNERAVGARHALPALRPGSHSEWGPSAGSTPPLRRPAGIQFTLEQQLTTRDAANWRLVLETEYVVVDAATAARVRGGVGGALSRLVQQASRELVAALTRDELLDGKDVLIQFVRADVGPKARGFGVTLSRIRIRHAPHDEN